MRSWSRPLPLSPRPMPGEAVLSWVARLAARYDMTGPELLAWVNDGNTVHFERVAGLNWRRDAEMDLRLAAAADIGIRMIGALRVPSGNGEEAAKWARTRLAWCSDCLREDVAHHAESHGRLAWRLGFCVICPRHLRLLEDCCSACGSIDCGFAFRLGRSRLVCAACCVMVDQLPDQVLSRPAWAAGPLGLLPSAVLNRLVVALQTDLMASMFGATSRSWKNRGVAERLASTVRELSAILLEAASVGAWRPLRLPQQVAVFSALSVRTAYDLLGLGAVVLTEAATGTSSDVERLEFGFPCDVTAPVTLARLFSELGWRDLDKLRARAPDWSP